MTTVYPRSLPSFICCALDRPLLALNNVQRVFLQMLFVLCRGEKAARLAEILGLDPFATASANANEDAAASPASAVSSSSPAALTMTRRRRVAITIKYASFEFKCQFLSKLE